MDYFNDTLLQTIINTTATTDSTKANDIDVVDRKNVSEKDKSDSTTRSDSQRFEFTSYDSDSKLKGLEMDEEEVECENSGHKLGKVQVRIFHQQRFNSIFAKFLEQQQLVLSGSESTNNLNDKVKNSTNPHITTSAFLSLYTALKEFLSRLIAEISLISEEFSDLQVKCRKIYKKRKITLYALSKDCKKLKELKRQSQNIFESIEFDIDENGKQSDQCENMKVSNESMSLIINAAIKRLKIDQINISDNFVDVINSISDSDLSDNDKEEDVDKEVPNNFEAETPEIFNLEEFEELKRMSENNKCE